MAKIVSNDIIQKCVDALARNDGHKVKAAKELGIPSQTLTSRIHVAIRRGLTARDSPPPKTDAVQTLIDNLRSEITTLREQIAKAQKPRFTVRQDGGGSSEKIRVVCIGDAHDSPSIPDKSRFEYIGRYINETKPDLVIQIGDFATLDSLNSHVGNETYGGKSKPTFIADMVSFNEALDAMQIDKGIERHCTLGNHERRLYLFEERAPQAYGMMQFELQKVFERHAWTFSPYGVPYVVGGVSFVHACLNSLGKAYGGKNSEGTIANDAIGDWVIGHSHRERMHRAAKLGGNNHVKILNVGCALPDGFIEEYAQHTLTGWSWGIADMTIQRGHVNDYSFVSMERLGERYGNKK